MELIVKCAEMDAELWEIAHEPLDHHRLKLERKTKMNRREGACATCKWAAINHDSYILPYDGNGKGLCTKEGQWGTTFHERKVPRMDLLVSECWEYREPDAEIPNA